MKKLKLDDKESYGEHVATYESYNEKRDESEYPKQYKKK